jgi:hypothetical protein
MEPEKPPDLPPVKPIRFIFPKGASAKEIADAINKAREEHGFDPPVVPEPDP